MFIEAMMKSNEIKIFVRLNEKHFQILILRALSIIEYFDQVDVWKNGKTKNFAHQIR